VAVESTGTYWVPIHTVLEGSVGLIVGNAYKIKHTPGTKNDLADADWIVELCLSGMVEPSRIFPKAGRDLRRLTNIFGKASQTILNGLLEGRTIDNISQRHKSEKA
jgi:transposase